MSRETLVPAIPDINQDNVLDALRSIKATLEVREGYIGDPLDKGVTLRDLTSLNLASAGGTTTTASGKSLPVGTVGQTLADGYDPTTDFTTPAQPTGFKANGGVANVYLTWDKPTYRNHSYTEVWRASVDNIGSAVMIGTTLASVYADAAQEDSTYYYWIRFVSQANVTGPYNSTAGTPAKTAVNVEKAIAALSSSIANSQLYLDLSSRIEAAQIAIDQNQRDLLDELDVARNNLYAQMNGNGSSIINLQKKTANTAAALTALNSTVTDPATGLAKTRADLTTLYYTKVDANTAISNAVQNLVSTSGLSSALSAYTTTASLTTNYYTKTDANTAISSAITTLSSSVSAVSFGLGLDQWVLNGQSIVTLSDGKVGTTALRLNGISGAYPNQGNFIPVNPGKTYRVKFWARPSSNATGILYFSLRQFTAPNASSPGPDNGGRSPYKPSGQSRSAHISTYGDTWGEYSYTWSTADWQAGVKYVQPEFLDNYSGGAGYWEVQGFTFVDVTDITTTNNALQAEALTRSNTDNSLLAQYTIKIDQAGRVAGIGLASTTSPADGTTSTFAVKADRFYVAPPLDFYQEATPTSGVSDGKTWFKISTGVTYIYQASTTSWIVFNPVIPFVVQTTATTLNGQNVPAGVYMNDAFIKNGTITNAKIGSAAIDTLQVKDGAITNAKIDTLDATKITAGTLDAARIAANSITASKIDSTNLTIKDSSGHVIFGSGTNLDASNINPAAGWLNSNIQVGGTNLMKQSGRFNSVTGISDWGSNGGTVTLDSSVTFGGYSTLKVVGNGGAVKNTVMRLKANTTYVVSALVKGGSALSGSGSTHLHIQNWRDEDTGNVHQETIIDYDQDITTSWKVVRCVFRTVASAAATYCRFYFYPLAAGFTLNVAYVKLEVGTVYTDWTPAPEEITNSSISIGSDGTLYGGSGGQVTYGGLGGKALGLIDSITAANISTYIAGAAIGFAYIADDIQSTDFVAGSAGWRIAKGGSMEMNNATFRGTLSTKSATTGARMEMSNAVIKVYDSGGHLRVQLGDLSA